MSKSKKACKPVRLIAVEQIAVVGSGAVDREAKVIRGVKVLGLESGNPGRVLGLDRRAFGDACDKPYRYSPEAVKAAISLYEGKPVNLDHLFSQIDPDGKRLVTGNRSVTQRIGCLENVRFDDGLVADLKYLASHPFAEAVLEMAERMPDQIALSHHATCQFELLNGQAVAVSIEDVRSVDLIGERPGTTKTLFESAADSDSEKETTVALKTLKEVSESAKPAKFKDFFARALELDDSLGALPMPDDMSAMDAMPEDADPATQMRDAVKAMIAGVVDDTALDTAAKLAKIEEYLTLLDSADAASKGKPADDAAAKPDAATEALARENKQLKSAMKVRELCESKGVKPSPVTVKALSLLETEAEQLAAISDLALAVQPAPRSTTYHATESREPFGKPADGKAFAASIRN